MSPADPIGVVGAREGTSSAARRTLVVGAGCSLGCPPDELLDLIEAALRELGAQPGDVRALATVDRRADEPGIVEAARHHRWPLELHPAAALARVAVPTPSPRVAAHVGTPSVAEAAALLTAGAAELLVPKRRSAHATCAIAARPPGARAAGAAATPVRTPAVVPREPDRPSAPHPDGTVSLATGAVPTPANAPHQPDQPPAPPVGATIFVATAACRGCGACLPTCPERALRPGPAVPGATPLVTLADRCTGCGECLEICPADAFVEVIRS